MLESLKLAVVLNRKAGALGQQRSSRIRSRFLEIFRKHGLEPTLFLVSPGKIEACLRQLPQDGYNAVIVGGGDGSLGTAANLFAGTDMILGILPLGTFNLFAKDLGLPLDPGAAADALARGRVQAVDVGEVNGLLFLNKATLGIHPLAVEKREEYRVQWGIGKATAMTYALFYMLWRLPARRLRLKLDGDELTLKTPFLLLSNNLYESNAFLFPQRAALDAGCLGVFYTHHLSRWRLFKMALLTLFGRPFRTMPELVHFCTREVTVESRRGKLRLSVDGEVLKMKTPLKFRIRHRALNMIIPGLPD